MAADETFNQAVTLLYEAALDDGCWLEAFTAIDKLCGLKGGQLTVTGTDADGNNNTLFAFGYQYGEDIEEIVADWVENYSDKSANIDRLLTQPVDRLLHNEQLFTDEEKARSPMYNEFQPRYDCRNQLAVVVDRAGGLAGPHDTSFWTMARDNVHLGDEWWADDLMRIKALQPHIRQTIRMSRELARTETGGAMLWESATLGMLSLDRRGSIVWANELGEAILVSGSGIRRHGDALVAQHPADDRHLRGLLSAALPRFGQTQTGGEMAVRRNGSPPLSLRIHPLTTRRRDFGADRAAALVLIRDPDLMPRIDPRLVAKALDLTPAEGRVAAQLAQGSTVRDIAVNSGRSENTVRWTLKNVLDKTHCKRQADLVRIVVRLATVDETNPLPAPGGDGAGKRRLTRR